MNLVALRQLFEQNIDVNKQYWRSRNICDLCWHGECMCVGIMHRDPSDHLALKKVDGKWRTVVVCEPIGKDEHMA